MAKRQIFETAKYPVKKRITKTKQFSAISFVNFEKLISSYNFEKIDKSVILYFNSIKRWIDGLLAIVEEVENKKTELFTTLNEIADKIDDIIVYNQDFCEEEITLLELRWEFIKNKYNFDTSKLKKQLLNFKSQAELIENKLHEINKSNNQLQLLYNLEVEKRPTFYFVAENTYHLVSEAFLFLDWFESNKDFSNRIFEIHDIWKDDFATFLTKKKSDFFKICLESSIEPERVEKWFSEWKEERILIESKLLPIIERVLKNNLNPEIALDLITCFEIAKTGIDSFYLDKLKKIHIETADLPLSKLQEKIKREIEHSSIINDFQDRIINIIFHVDIKSEEKIFIVQLAKEWLDMQIDEITSFLYKNNLTNISQKILNDFRDLKRKNIEVFMHDVKFYAKSIKEREEKYNELMFRMKKEINTNNIASVNID